MRQNDEENIGAGSGETKLTDSKRYTESGAGETSVSEGVIAKAIRRMRAWARKTCSGQPLAGWPKVSNVKSESIATAIPTTPDQEFSMNDERLQEILRDNERRKAITKLLSSFDTQLTRYEQMLINKGRLPTVSKETMEMITAEKSGCALSKASR